MLFYYNWIVFLHGKQFTLTKECNLIIDGVALLNFILKALEHSVGDISISCELFKVFDCVGHELLIQNLEQWG